MNKSISLSTLLAAAFALAGCESGLTPYAQGGTTVIATAYDTGHDHGKLGDGDAAIAYDPDGCQGWIIDDGLEGYSGRRYDPLTGLPVCNGLFPPGTVVGNYQSATPGIGDWVPGHRVTN